MLRVLYVTGSGSHVFTLNIYSLELGSIMGFRSYYVIKVSVDITQLLDYHLLSKIIEIDIC